MYNVNNLNEKLRKLNQQLETKQNAFHLFLDQVWTNDDGTKKTLKQWHDSRHETETDQKMMEYNRAIEKLEKEISYISGAIVFKKSDINNHYSGIINNAIIESNLSGKPINKRKENRLREMIRVKLNLPDNIKITIVRDFYTLSVCFFDTTGGNAAWYNRTEINVYNAVDRRYQEGGKEYFSETELKNVKPVLTDKEYIKHAKKAIKENERVNKKIETLKNQVKKYCDDFQHETGCYISSYMEKEKFQFIVK